MADLSECAGRLAWPVRQARFVLAALAACLIFGSSASATITETFGGPGGGGFRLRCDRGEFLIGVHARAGAWVDAIGLVCASYNSATGKVSTARKRRGMTGGRGGGPQEVYCKPGEALTGLGMAFTRGGGLERQYVNTIDIFCQYREHAERCISTGEGCGYIPSRVRGTIVQIGVDWKYDRVLCPSNEYAIGIQGKSGLFVDSMGLICEPYARARPRPSSPRPSSSRPPNRGTGPVVR